jgi:hypothetical protein
VGLLPSLDSPFEGVGAPTAVVHGQFDGGNRTDLAVLDPTAETVTIWRVTLFGRFDEWNTLATGNGPWRWPSASSTATRIPTSPS